MGEKAGSGAHLLKSAALLSVNFSLQQAWKLDDWPKLREPANSRSA